MSPTSTIRTVPVPLLDKDGGKILVLGRPDAPRLAFLQAGFPDDHDVLLPFAKRLAEADCLVGVGCMPEFDRASDAIIRPDGYTLPQTATCFRQGVEALKAQSASSTAPLFLVVHDWGMAPGAIYTNQAVEEGTAPSGIVFFDVLPPPRPPSAGTPPSWVGAAVQVNYQLQFATTFLLRRYVGKPVAALACAAITLTTFGIFGRWTHPINNPRDSAGGRGDLLRRMVVKEPSRLTYKCYPYFHAFRAVLTGGGSGVFGRMGMTLPPLDRVPVLYLYGGRKNTFFHTRQALDALDAAEGSSHQAIEGAGHWLYLHEEDECVARVTAFMGA